MICVYEVTGAFTTYMFLCEPCAAARRLVPQVVKVRPIETPCPVRVPIELPQQFGCDDCKRSPDAVST